MKKKNRSLICTLIIMGALITLTNSCEKNDDNDPDDDKSGIIFNPDLTYGTVKDVDDNAYKTIDIGTQTWMAENLKVTHYRNGDPIPNVTSGTEWKDLNTGAYCNYNNDLSNSITYGKLYNFWAVADSRNLCPSGWHVPTSSEYQTLIYFLGGNTIAGGKMKEIGTIHWYEPNTGATNESGFTGLPGGINYRGGNDTFSSMAESGYWWSSTEQDATFAWYRYLNYESSKINLNTNYSYHKSFGFSVRCLKD